MIPVFRKIRQRLAFNNKPGKYMRYALGEIFLVMVGILLALQINNWNELEKKKREEQEILNNLLKDLKIARDLSLEFLANEENNVQYLLSCLDINPNGIPLEEYQLTDSIFKVVIWDMITRIPVINSYSEIKNSGKTSYIRNNEILKAFTRIELAMNSLRFIIDDRTSVQQIRLDDIPAQELNFVGLLDTEIYEVDVRKEIKGDYKTILRKPKIRNLLAMKLMLSWDVIESRTKLNTEIDKLIVLLEKELNGINP